ncbi:MAG: hypothetical protein AAGG08_21155 [Actinomycetota bacterium]
MKKFALALMAAAAAVFGVGMVADAYPPPVSSPTIDDPTAVDGQTVTIQIPCVPPETVTLTIVFDLTNATIATLTDECEPTAAPGFALLGSATATGVATFTVTAPSTVGGYTATATGSASGALGAVTFTVSAASTPTGGLPATGSDGIGTTTWIAGSLLLVGLGLFAVATVRRRQPAAA